MEAHIFAILLQNLTQVHRQWLEHHAKVLLVKEVPAQKK
jgi:hypothetical protein